MRETIYRQDAIGVPVPERGTAYIFDSGDNIERIGRAVMVAKEEGRRNEQTNLFDYDFNFDGDFIWVCANESEPRQRSC